MLLFLATMQGHICFHGFPVKVHVPNALLHHSFHDISLMSP